MITLLSLYNRITGQAWSMFDSDVEDQDEFESAVITSIQKALSYLWNSYSFPFRIKQYELKTKSGKDSYPLPNGNIIRKVVKDEEVYSVKYEKTFLPYLNDYEILQEQTGSPKGFYVKNDNLYIYPTPDDIYKVNIEYLTTMAVLSADNQTKANLELEDDKINIPERYEDLFIETIMPLAQLYNIASYEDENYTAYKEQFEKAYRNLIEFTQGIEIIKSIGW